MSKKLIIVICTLLMLCGCSTKKVDDVQNQKLELYTSYYKSVLDNEAFMDASENYDISYEISALPDKGYTYVIIIDNPKVAMYNVKAIGVSEDSSYMDDTHMALTTGIFDNSYNLVPYQINKDEGYVKGLIMNGESNESTFDVRLMITWDDQGGATSTKEFIKINVDINAVEEKPQVIED